MVDDGRQSAAAGRGGNGDGVAGDLERLAVGRLLGADGGIEDERDADLVALVQLVVLERGAGVRHGLVPARHVALWILTIFDFHFCLTETKFSWPRGAGAQI